MAEAFVGLDSLLDYFAKITPQEIISPRSLKWIYYLLAFVLAVLGAFKEKRRHHTRIPLKAVKHLASCVLVDSSFVLLGAVLDYFAERVGKRKFAFTVLLLPTQNRIGISAGFLLDVCLSPPDTSFIFRLAFFLPLFITPAGLIILGEPENELLVDPVWAGVPLIAYIFGWWASYDPPAVLSVVVAMWEYRWLILYIVLGIGMNYSLISSACTGVVWLCTKSCQLVWKYFLGPLLGLLAANIGARIRRRSPYSAIYSTTDTDEPYQYRPLGKGNNIRLLRLWPRGPSDTICCELGERSLDHSQSSFYEAISYTWGEPNKTHTIILDGRRFPVTKNVYELLCDHSSSWKNKILWIDSICINQADNIEKPKQILLMDKIYKSAYRVVVYLGSDLDCHLAIRLLKELKVLVEYSFTGQDVYLKYQSETNSPRWIALMRMLSHPWFERVWIIQEVVMASKIVVRYGGEFIHWKTLTYPVRLLASDEARMLTLSIKGDKDMMQSALAKLPHIELLERSREEFQQGITMSFQDVMFRYPTFKATDARDKVFGLLGCVSNTSALPESILPDYEKSVRDVYFSTASFILSSKESGLLLAHTGIGWDRKVDDLPSWAPDWTSIDGPCTLGGPHCSYRASGSSQFFIQPGHLPESVVLSIIFFDSIEKLGSLHPLQQPAREQPANTGPSTRFSDEHSVIRNRKFYEWVREAAKLVRGCGYHYSSEEAVEETLWRTLIGDLRLWQQSPAPDEYGGMFRDWTHIYDTFNTFEDQFNNLSQGVRDPSIDALEKEMKARFGPSGKENSTRMQNAQKWAIKAGIVSSYRRFCVTKSASVGLVPPKSECGDLIGFISGLKTPFVLRMNTTNSSDSKRDLDDAASTYYSRTYSIVGECYIHGMMDGQSLNLESVTPCLVV